MMANGVKVLNMATGFGRAITATSISGSGSKIKRTGTASMSGRTVTSMKESGNFV